MQRYDRAMPTPPLPSLRQQAALRDRWLGQRLAGVVPAIMRRHDIEAWVLVAREYNEDPVVATMLPATWLSARRRTILVFTDHGDTRAAIARYPVDGLFPAEWDPDEQPDQWAALAEHLDAADPATIALNVSEAFPLADGLSHHEREAMMRALPERLRPRAVSGESLAIGWLETRLPVETEALADACRSAHELLRRGLSAEAIVPGSTTTRDLEWWLRDETRSAGLDVWFHPAASVQRADGSHSVNLAADPNDDVISAGDLIHVDFGIVRLGLHTDQQQHAYVLRHGQTDVPNGLRQGMANANRVQDLLMAEFKTGRSGNDILHSALAAANVESLDATIYTHALGLHGHAAGPTIGLWDRQDGVPGPGDYPLYPDTAYSIELSVGRPVAEWDGQVVRFMVEEDAFFDGTHVGFLDGRQTEIWRIG